MRVLQVLEKGQGVVGILANDVYLGWPRDQIRTTHPADAEEVPDAFALGESRRLNVDA
jgi:hypothetical protein